MAGHINGGWPGLPMWALDFGKALDWTTLDFRRPLLKLHPHRPCLSVTIGSETAPLPRLGPLHENWSHKQSQGRRLWPSGAKARVFIGSDQHG